MWINYDDVHDQLLQLGLMLKGPVEVNTTLPVRCKVEGEDREERGWYWVSDILLEDGKGGSGSYLVGAAGVYHGNDNGKVALKLRRDGKSVLLTPEQKVAIAERRRVDAAKMKAERARLAEVAATRALVRWNEGTDTGASTYLQKKSIGAHAIRFAPGGVDEIYIPIRNGMGRLFGVQIIRGNPSENQPAKQYWPAGVAVHGHYHLIGPTPRGVLIVTEGYATAASIFEATGIPVAIAFSANNLVHGAKELSKLYRGVKLLIAADDDYHTEGNPGVTAASAASTAVTGSYLAPVFTDARPTDRKGPTDFNDLARLEGLPIVRAQIEAHLSGLGWLIGRTPARGIAEQGEGEARLAMMTPEQVVSRFSPVWSTDDVFYFDHHERVLCTRVSIAARMPRSGWDAVTAHPDWREKPEVPITAVDFDPAETDTSVTYNMWGGMPSIITGASSSCSAILALMRHLYSHEPGNAQAALDWSLNWMAYPLQHPGAKMQSCILMHGGQGAGKNAVFDTLLEIHGTEHAVQFGPSQLEKRFNALFSKKLLAIGNEVVASREDLYHVKGHIKHMITERRWVVEAKHRDERWERNCCNFIFLSNEINPQALDKGDRRHLVIWTPEVPDPDRDKTEWGKWQKLWTAAYAERRNGGAAALYEFLMARPLGDFCEATWPPMTQAKQDLIDLNQDSRERFFALWQNEEIGGLPCSPCISEDLYEGYRVWTQRVGIARCVPLHSLMAFIGKQPGIRKSQERIQTGFDDVRRTVVFSHGVYDPPLSKTKAQWLGEYTEAFKQALESWKEKGEKWTR